MKLVLLPDVVKDKFVALIQPIIRFFVHYKLNPNFFTTISFIICISSAYQFAKGSLRLAAVLLLLGGLFDMVDGAVARASNRVTKFGALYDSTLDRYAEIVIYFGIMFYFVVHYVGDSKIGLLYAMAVFIGLAGSLMVSYVRARAEGLGFSCKVGVMQRPERIVLLGVGALISKYTFVFAILFIAFFANYTAIQRIFHIWAKENSSKWNKLPPDIAHE